MYTGNGNKVGFTVLKTPFYIPKLGRLSECDCKDLSILYECDSSKCEPLNCADLDETAGDEEAAWSGKIFSTVDSTYKYEYCTVLYCTVISYSTVLYSYLTMRKTIAVLPFFSSFSKFTMYRDGMLSAQYLSSFDRTTQKNESTVSQRTNSKPFSRGQL